MGYAHQAFTTLQPLFPDSAACEVVLDFQTGRQPWFEAYEAQLVKVGKSLVLPAPETVWNTPHSDEYGLVSWGESDEVYFVRKNRETGEAKVMTSRFQDTAWTAPVPVEELSVSSDVIPLSIYADGHLMVLKSGGRLMESYRPAAKRRWSYPTRIPYGDEVSGRAVLSQDGSFLLVENYSSPIGPLERPKSDLYMVTLGDDGRYGNLESIGDLINLEDGNEADPLLALGGRVLFFASEREGGLGEMDLYSIPLDKPNDWTTAGEPLNMGLQLNTIFEEEGLTFFSEYTGKGYFDRLNTCTGDRDIYSLDIGADAFPDNALRLAGIVLDENRKPVGGGFMEFLPDYSLSAHSQPISSKGSYTFTVPENTAVVRLFPEVPGFYSERDTTHFLVNLSKGQIIRDTFYLTSFEYIREHFKLEHSTFKTGTAIFNNPDQTYPELTRFAKIATRMGAELDLIGHTDGTGEVADNMQLSEDRARSVKEFLVNKCGFDPAKIRVSGFGPTKPLCPNDTEEGRRCNRRVEVVFRMPEGG
jgi:outer membrane protein OmpA-like peptidoglycan-associated protein